MYFTFRMRVCTHVMRAEELQSLMLSPVSIGDSWPSFERCINRSGLRAAANSLSCFFHISSKVQ